MMPEVPGIIEAWMTITPEPDGRVSFRVLLGADSNQPRGCDLIELIIGPEYIGRALAGAKIPALAGTETTAEDKLPTFPCHVGLYISTGHGAA
jgi:hypothetical protein